MKKIIYLLCIIIFGCSKDSSISNTNHIHDPYYKLYVTNQSENYVAVFNSETGELIYNINVGGCDYYLNSDDCVEVDGCVWHESMNHCMGDGSGDEDVCDIYNLDQEGCENVDVCMWMGDHCMEEQTHAPHFISIDEQNGFWFVTLMQSGYLEQYDLNTDELISRKQLGDLPALSVIDTDEQKIYISRMSMQGMEAQTNIINVVSYSELGMVIEEDINFCEQCTNPIGPHALAINNISNDLYTASINSDFIFHIDYYNNQVLNQVSLDGDEGAIPDLTTKKFKPIQCSLSDEFLFITCQGGTWVNGNEDINGQVMMFNRNNLEYISKYEFSSDSGPWHIITDTLSSRIYVALSGEFLGGGQGVACLSYSSNSLDLFWHNENIDGSMEAPHGISLSSDRMKLFVSDRSNGILYFLDSQTGNIITKKTLGQGYRLGGIANTSNVW